MPYQAGRIVIVIENRTAVINILQVCLGPLLNSADQAARSRRAAMGMYRNMAVYIGNRSLRVFQHSSDNPADRAIVGTEIGVDQAEILHGYNERTRADYRPKEPEIIKSLARRIREEQAGYRMFLTIEVAGKPLHRFPFRELGRIRHVERSVGIEHVLVHHDVLRELAAGSGIVWEFRVAVHDGGKAVEFGRI